MIFLLFYFVVILASSEIEVESSNAAQTSTIPEIPAIAQQKDEAISCKKEMITITNNITPEMLQYKHWTGTYSPENFTLSINDTKVNIGESYTLTNINDPLVITFDYSFMNGMRKGGKKVSYTMKENITTASLSFSWLEDHKIIIDNATLLRPT
jgi:hypothetical protein